MNDKFEIALLVLLGLGLVGLAIWAYYACPPAEALGW